MKAKGICLLISLGISGLFLVGGNKFLSYGEDKDGKEYKTEHVSDWKFLKGITTPNPKTFRIKDYVVLPNPKDKNGFPAEPDKRAIKLDTDGDGKMDKTVSQKESIVDYKYGSTNQPYSMRIWQEQTEKTSYWCYQRACFRKAQAEGETFILIDDNNNGYYNEYGVDALLVGKNKQAGPLSKMVLVKGKLYEFETDDLGNKILLKEYKGPTGEINLKRGLNFKYKPKMVVLQSGEIALNIPLEKETFMIPTGEYNLHLAIFTDRIRARNGTLPPINIETDKPTILKWGGPFKLGINPVCEKGGELVTIIPPAEYVPPERRAQKLDCPFIKMESPTICGAYGEEYFAPDEVKGQYDWFVLPDPGITFFNVEIIAKEACGAKYPKGKILNKIGYPLVDNWTQVDLSGLVVKQPPYWEKYQCPLYEYKGTVILKVSANSQTFGGKISFEQEIKVE